MGTWALKKGAIVAGVVANMQGKRTMATETGHPEDITKSLVSNEKKIKERRNNLKEEADNRWKEIEQQDLAKLKEIHQDQESLAWYIMKREEELNTLEKKLGEEKEKAEKAKRDDEDSVEHQAS